MQVVLRAVGDAGGTVGEVTVEVLVVNDSYELISVDRRRLIGPNAVTTAGPLPVSMEPAFDDEQRNLVDLNPDAVYGRRRTFAGLPPGDVQFYAYLLSEPADRLLPHGPVDESVATTTAEPLVITTG